MKGLLNLFWSLETASTYDTGLWLKFCVRPQRQSNCAPGGRNLLAPCIACPGKWSDACTFLKYTWLPYGGSFKRFTMNSVRTLRTESEYDFFVLLPHDSYFISRPTRASREVLLSTASSTKHKSGSGKTLRSKTLWSKMWYVSSVVNNAWTFEHVQQSTGEQETS